MSSLVNLNPECYSHLNEGCSFVPFSVVLLTLLNILQWQSIISSLSNNEILITSARPVVIIPLKIMSLENLSILQYYTGAYRYQRY